MAVLAALGCCFRTAADTRANGRSPLVAVLIWKIHLKVCIPAILCGGIQFEPHHRLWRSWAPLKVKIFVWLACWKRCWTSHRLACRGLPHPDKCPLCDQQEEDIDHLLISYVFVREVWHQVLSWVRLQEVTPTPQEQSFQLWWRRVERRLIKEHRKGFNTLVMLVAWETWKHSNKCVFDGVAPRTQVMLTEIKQEAQLWAKAGAKKLRSIL